jgi:UDP-N-acetyl-D-mannosaminuronate dehydrogenase
MEARVLGIGVGYSLACYLAEAGYDTVRVDIDPRVVANPRVDASTQRLLECDRTDRKNAQKRLKLSTDYKGEREWT